MKDINLASGTGFALLKPFGRGLEARVARQQQDGEAVRPLSKQDAVWDEADDSRKEQKIRRMQRFAEAAYMNDGFVRQSIDRHTEMFTDFELVGADDVLQYLDGRLAIMALQTGNDWKTVFDDIIFEFFKLGTAHAVKIRGAKNIAKRPLYAGRPYALSGLSCVSTLRLDPDRDKTGKFRGFKRNDLHRMQTGNNGLVVANNSLPTELALVAGSFDDSEGTMYKDVDIVTFTYKKGADDVYGYGAVFAGLEDVSILRGLETTTVVSVKKNTHPIIQHSVERPTFNPMGGIQPDLDYAQSLWGKIGPDGVIITPGTHKINVHGMESMAMRTDSQLKHFSARTFVGLGVSPFLMGFEAGTLGTAEAAIELLMTKIRYCQEYIGRMFVQKILNEILWEGGFDPYRNPEHRVRMRFKFVDESRQIKVQTHAVDSWVKGAIDFDEMREIADWTGEADRSLLYVNMVQIPLEEAKAKAKAAAAPPPSAGPPAKPAKKPASKEALRSQVLHLLPSKPAEVEDSVLLLQRLHGLDYSNARERMELLAGDEEALLELLFEHYPETEETDETGA